MLRFSASFFSRCVFLLPRLLLLLLLSSLSLPVSSLSSVAAAIPGFSSSSFSCVCNFLTSITSRVLNAFVKKNLEFLKKQNAKSGRNLFHALLVCIVFSVCTACCCSRVLELLVTEMNQGHSGCLLVRREASSLTADIRFWYVSLSFGILRGCCHFSRSIWGMPSCSACV